MLSFRMNAEPHPLSSPPCCIQCNSFNVQRASDDPSWWNPQHPMELASKWQKLSTKPSTCVQFFKSYFKSRLFCKWQKFENISNLISFPSSARNGLRSLIPHKKSLEWSAHILEYRLGFKPSLKTPATRLVCSPTCNMIQGLILHIKSLTLHLFSSLMITTIRIRHPRIMYLPFQPQDTN